jgi:hypothetical protein
MRDDRRLNGDCAEDRGAEKRGREEAFTRGAEQDKRTRHGGRVTSLSAQGFLSHAAIPVCVNENHSVLIYQRIGQHGYAGAHRRAQTGVQRRG